MRFSFSALDRIALPAGKAGNVLRGALGLTLQKQPEAAAALSPAAEGSRPSGLGNLPGAFVLRAAHLDGIEIASGGAFHVDLHLFQTGDRAAAAVAVLHKAFCSLAREGFGPRRGRAELLGVTRIDGSQLPIDSSPMRLSLAPSTTPCFRIRVEFATPTELKFDSTVTSRPEFHILFKRVRDRIATLRALYGSGPLYIDFRAMAERAAGIQLDDYSLTEARVNRRSSRTGQVHGIGGFVGHAEYSGELSEFLPWLEAAHWTGAGRQTTWGKGCLQICRLSSKPD